MIVQKLTDRWINGEKEKLFDILKVLLVPYTYIYYYYDGELSNKHKNKW